MVMSRRRRSLAFARKANRFVNRPVAPGVPREFCRRSRDGLEVIELTRSLEALALVAPRFRDVAVSEIGIAQVAQDPVGDLLLPELAVDAQRTVAMFERLLEVAGGPRRDAQRHVGVRHAEQALGIRRCPECL